ncbi:DUF4230 domain-containing protein [Trichothermofontia sichuanensis B231]|uniref:DUF4230 domain-containing protein n=1 Tax=Trichothermofontia sichuanensis TaxID=3045816 RepID=UPI0022463C3B|nr:DUF4230 domain-containing protein [Trichothermofontia sichuanensis]UZQ54768.1 DUF4230 domain-containing protein [Trichothermofontia sichuanensis B231]
MNSPLPDTIVPTPAKPSTGSRLRNFLLLSAGGVGLITSLILVGMWQMGANLTHRVQRWLTLFEPAPSVDPRTLIVQQVRGASELTTAVFAMEAVVPAQQDRKLGDLTIGRTTLLYIAHGEVRAGIDLSQLTPAQVQVQGQQVVMTLPPPQILDRKIDVTKSSVYEYDRGFLGLGPDTGPALQQLAQRTTLDRILATACQQGILQKANERAEVAVTQLLTLSGYDSVQVKTQTPPPHACQPSVHS